MATHIQSKGLILYRNQTNPTNLSRLSCLPHLPCDAVYRVKRFCYFIGVAKAYGVKCACPVECENYSIGTCPVECENYSMGSLFHWDSINTMNVSYELNDLNVPNGHNGQLVSPFLIVYNVTGVETNGFQTCDIARVKEIPGKLPG
jgi:hypothetical protein